MANKKQYITVPPIPLIRQRIALMVQYPDTTCSISKNVLHWKGVVKPSPLSKEYPVTITYQIYHRPNVIIYDQDNIFPGCQHPPHVFRVDEEKGNVSICLYFGSYEFSSKNLLANTIVPWSVEWLYFYEIWLSTGSWEGGGHSINISKK